MGWSSLLEDITERVSSALGQIDLQCESGDNETQTSDRVVQLVGLRATCERLLIDLKQHLSLATREDLDLADTVIKLEQEKGELVRTKIELSQALEETQKLLKRKTKEEAATKRSYSGLQAQQKRLWLEENRKPRLGAAQPKKIKTKKRGMSRTFIQNTAPEERYSDQVRTESNTPQNNHHSPQVRILLLRPKVADSQESQIIEAHNPSVLKLDDAKSNITQSQMKPAD